MSRQGISGPGPVPLLLGTVLLLMGIGAFFFGTKATLTIARAGAGRMLIDGAVALQPGGHLTPLVLNTTGDPAAGEVACSLVQNGVSYPGRVYMPAQGGWTLVLDSLSPLGPRTVAITRPTDPSRIAWKAALDMAGILGLATARLEVVPAVVNGVPGGLLQWGEELGPEMERLRGLHGLPVPVFSCPEGHPWIPGAEWADEGPASGLPLARARLQALLERLNDHSLPDSVLTDSLAALIDIDAFLRLRVWEDLVLDGRRVVPLLVAGTPAGRLYPVLPAHPRFLPDSLSAGDLLDRTPMPPVQATRLAELREQALSLLAERGVWRARVQELADGLAPHVARDHQATFLLPELGEVPVRISVLDWEAAVRDLLQRFGSPDHGS